MNRIQRNKLYLSKWTAIAPSRREKHFIVTAVIEDEDEPVRVVIEAVHSKREQSLVWTELKNDTIWRQGWH